jgi:hypothetical protein
MATDSPPIAEQKSRKLRWFQYRLRSLFVLTTLVAIACSWLAVMRQEQRKEYAAAEAIRKAGGAAMSEQTWLGKLLRDNTLIRVSDVDLEGKPIADDVLMHFDGLSQLHSVQLIGITDAGLAHLRGASRLDNALLSGTEVTDAGMVHLQGLGNLKRLTFVNTSVTDQGVKKLQQALPKCYVDRR